MHEHTDVAIVGAGAAGLMSAIWAARRTPGRRIVILDGARTLGAKILVAGGGRCNVTHDVVDEASFSGSSRHAIKNVLRRFTVDQTVAFFREIGVELKREETGKLFPVTDDARTVLHALLSHARELGVQIVHPRRVASLVRDDSILHSARGEAEGAAIGTGASPRFRLAGDWGSLACSKVVLATGGRSLPKSGSDGGGYELACSLGHSLTPRLLPALVPLLLPPGHVLNSLSGVAAGAELQVRSPTGRKLAAFTGSVLCTHFGLSGPCVLDISRHFLYAAADEPGCVLVANWLPGESFDSLDRDLAAAGAATIGARLRERLPARLGEALASFAGVDPGLRLGSLSREPRRALVRAVVEMPLPVTGSRGFTYAEVTAGGVPLDEIHLSTMESRRCEGLHLCGEICDVDGRIGGYNFQWAWSSGYTAGVGV